MAGGLDNPVSQVVHVVYRARRRVWTVLAIVLALGFGWHAFFGHNGVTAYAQKRNEDRQLKEQIETLTEENAKLQDHVQHLQTDPDTIEMEARQRLHYTRPGEVIYTLNDKPKQENPQGK